MKLEILFSSFLLYSFGRVKKAAFKSEDSMMLHKDLKSILSQYISPDAYVKVPFRQKAKAGCNCSFVMSVRAWKRYQNT